MKLRDNESVVDALDEAVGKKANASELDSHIKDRANPHLVTKEQVGLGNVGNYKFSSMVSLDAARSASLWISAAS